jgi:hypothetical protein
MKTQWIKTNLEVDLYFGVAKQYTKYQERKTDLHNWWMECKPIVPFDFVGRGLKNMKGTPPPKKKNNNQANKRYTLRSLVRAPLGAAASSLDVKIGSNCSYEINVFSVMLEMGNQWHLYHRYMRVWARAVSLHFTNVSKKVSNEIFTLPSQRLPNQPLEQAHLQGSRISSEHIELPPFWHNGPSLHSCFGLGTEMIITYKLVSSKIVKLSFGLTRYYKYDSILYY